MKRVRDTRSRVDLKKHAWNIAAFVLAAGLAWGLYAWKGSSTCTVLLPDGVHAQLPSHWDYVVPSLMESPRRPSYLDLHALAPPLPLPGAPVGPPTRPVDTLLLVEVRSHPPGAEARILFDRYPPLEEFRSPSEVKPLVRVLEKIYRQEITDRHQGTSFAFQWGESKLEMQGDRYVFTFSFTRTLSSSRESNFWMRVIGRDGRGVRLETQRTAGEEIPVTADSQLDAMAQAFGF